MVVLIISLAISLIIAIRQYSKDADVPFLLYLFPPLLITVFITSILGFFINYNFTVAKSKIVETFEIISLNDNNQMQGRFFLGSGQIDSRSYFSMYSKDEFGYIDRLDLPTSNSSLVYTNEKPFVEKYEKFTDYDNILNWLFIPVTDSQPFYLIHIPNGTIINEFNLDLK